MILENVNTRYYEADHVLIREGVSWLREHFEELITLLEIQEAGGEVFTCDGNAFACDEPIVIQLPHSMRVEVKNLTSGRWEESLFETHDRFYDLHLVLRGEEKIGVCHREGLVVEKPYVSGNDITFYREPAASGSVILHVGDYVVLGPEEAHKPAICTEDPAPLKKIVMKIPV